MPIHTLPAPPVAPVVPWWSTLWNGVKHVVHVVASIVHAVVHKPASPQDVVGKGLLKAASQNSSCNAQGLLQVFCGDTIAQCAAYLPGGGQIGIPGPFHLGSGQGGGGGSHDHGGSGLSEVMYNDNDSGGTLQGGWEEPQGGHEEGKYYIPVKNLNPLHSPGTSGSRPELENLSDQELLNAVNNPKNGDPIQINTQTGKIMDGNGRAYELLRRSLLPGSSITPDTPVSYKPYTPTSMPEPWDEPPNLWRDFFGK